MAKFKLRPEYAKASSANVTVPGGTVIDAVALADARGVITTDDDRHAAALRGFFAVEEMDDNPKPTAKAGRRKES